MSTRDKEDTDVRSEVPFPRYLRCWKFNIDTKSIPFGFFKWFTVGMLLPLSVFCQVAETIRLTPGLWKIHTSTRLPAMSQSLSRQVTKCIDSGDIDPSQAFENSRQCSISEKEFKGDRMSWSLQCTVPGRGILNGRGNFSSQGDRAEGSTTLIVPYQGQAVEMVTTWSGQRLGECE